MGKLPCIINKLNNHGIKKISYLERCNDLNDDQVLMTRHFQYKVKVFFEETIFDDPLGKTEYAIRIEF